KEKGGGDKGTPAKVNHGNIPPSIERDSGGVTMSYARHTAVLSLAGLKRLRFSTRVDGSSLTAADRQATESAARVALAATALAGLALQRDYGYDLRSRSLLVPTEPFVLEILDRDGGEPIRRRLGYDDAVSLQTKAVAAAAAVGMGWSNEPLTLTPAPKLSALILGSRALSVTGDVEDN
ncbi:MAG: type I-U CRISPR-associated protein Cas7, partial [Planctomycetota bacterium]